MTTRGSKSPSVIPFHTDYDYVADYRLIKAFNITIKKKVLCTILL